MSEIALNECVRAFKGMALNAIAPSTKWHTARASIGPLSPTRTMKTTSFRVAANRCPTPQMQMQNRSWSIFFRAYRAALSPFDFSPAFTKLHHQSLRFVHLPSPPPPLFLLSSCVTLNIANRTGPADKLISTGKSCSSSCISCIRSPFSENPSPQSGTKNLIRSYSFFFRFLSHEHVAVSPFAFYSSSVIEKAAATLSTVC